MLSRTSEPQVQIDTSWPIAPLFCGLSVGLTGLSLGFVKFEGMVLLFLLAWSVFYAFEQTHFIRRVYRRWQSVMMMVASGQIGMCVGAWAEFGPLGLLNKYTICASLPGYGVELVVKTLSVAPMTHLGMFLGCTAAAVLVDPKLARNFSKLAGLALQTAAFVTIAIMVSKWASLLASGPTSFNYVLQILAMHLSMSLCMILTGLLIKQTMKHRKKG